MSSSHVAVHKPIPVGLPDGTTNTFVRKQIRKLRVLKGWTQRELAHAAGISASSLGCLETGFYRLNLDTLQKIIDALGVEISDVWPSRNGSNHVECSHPPQRARDQVHFYRLAEVHSLTGSEASCLFASNLQPALSQGPARKPRSRNFGRFTPSGWEKTNAGGCPTSSCRGRWPPPGSPIFTVRTTGPCISV